MSAVPLRRKVARLTTDLRKPSASVQEPERPQKLDHLAFVPRRQAGRSRVLAEKRVERRRNEIRTCPLQQELGHQNVIGIMRLTPGKGAAVRGGPGPDPTTEPPDILRRGCLRRRALQSVHLLGKFATAGTAYEDRFRPNRLLPRRAPPKSISFHCWSKRRSVARLVVFTRSTSPSTSTRSGEEADFVIVTAAGILILEVEGRPRLVCRRCLDVYGSSQRRAP